MLIIVVPIAVLAALLYALSDFTEQRAAQRAVHRDDRGSIGISESQIESIIRTVRRVGTRMARDPRWLLGWVIGTAGFFVQGVALHLGSVSVVQSLQVTTLLFAVPLSTVGLSMRPRWTDWLGGLLICGGLATLLLVRGHRASTGPVDRRLLLFAILILAGAVLVLVGVATLHSGITRPVALSLAAGAGFACSATLVKLTASDLTTVGIGGTARDWPGYTLALATATGVILQQAAFATGRLATATTGMTVTNPVVGTVVAAMGFHESVAHGSEGWALLALAGALVIGGVALLSNSPLLHGRESRHPEDEVADDSPGPHPSSNPSRARMTDFAATDASARRREAEG